MEKLRRERVYERKVVHTATVLSVEEWNVDHGWKVDLSWRVFFRINIKGL